MRNFLLALSALLMLALALPSFAQETTGEAPAAVIDKKKLLVQPRNADGTVQQVKFTEDPILWVREKQQAFYSKMSGALRQLKTGSALAAAWSLLFLSFGYGVFHAAGPGHGKTVISAWLLATESELKRGILISFMSAFIQALTAILIVSILFLIVASVGAAARNVAGVLESASYGLIGLMGLYLIWTAFREIRHAPPNRYFDTFQPLKADPHGHIHGADCGCGHAHLPAATDLKGDWSAARALSLSFAVGIRPCTGAILVLVFANGLGLYWAGIASTFAMAFGTFLTVSAIAALAVYSRKLASSLAGHDDTWLNWLGFSLRLGGGALIAFLGLMLFLGSLGATNAIM